MTKDPRVYLVHVLECAAKIRQYIASGEDMKHLVDANALSEPDEAAAEHACHRERRLGP